jgi:hypothetical protein
LPLSRLAAEPAALGGALHRAAALCAVSLALLHPAAVAAASRARLPHLVFWGLPLFAGLLAAVPFTGRRDGPDDPGTVATGKTRAGALARLLPFCVAAFACDQGFLGLGHLLGWVTFTYGEQSLVSHPFVAAAWGLPLCLAAGVGCYERALRGVILAGAVDRIGLPAALALSAATGTVLALPGILLGTSFPDRPFVAAAVAAAACREAASCVIFLSGGGILLAGLYRGWLFYFEGFVLNDINALFFPMANYASSEPWLYLLRAGTAILGAAALGIGGARARRRPARPTARPA